MPARRDIDPVEMPKLKGSRAQKIIEVYEIARDA
jgi:hypothetical protein